MPRKPTTPHPRWHNPLGLGTLYVRESGAGLWLWTSVGSKRESTGIRWPGPKRYQKKAQAEGMRLLADRVLLFKHPELRVASPSPTPATRSLYDVTATFLENRLPKLSTGIQVRFKACGQHLFMNGPDDGVPLEYDAPVDFMQARIIVTED